MVRRVHWGSLADDSFVLSCLGGIGLPGVPSKASGRHRTVDSGVARESACPDQLDKKFSNQHVGQHKQQTPRHALLKAMAECALLSSFALSRARLSSFT